MGKSEFRPRGRPTVQFDDRLKLNERTGCLEWTGCVARGGYGQVAIKRKMRYAHRVAYERARGPIPDGAFVLHRCDNPPCCNVEHLFLGSARDNMQDRLRKGRSPDFVGDKNPASKLNEHAVRNIRRLYADGMKQKDIADLYGVTQATVSHIVLRKKWSHIL